MEYTLVAFSLIERIAFARKFNLGFTAEGWQQKLEDQGFCCFLFAGGSFLNGSALAYDLETSQRKFAKSPLTEEQWWQGVKNGSPSDPFLTNSRLTY